MLKPDVTMRNDRIVGKILTRIEKTGLKLKALKMKWLTKDEAEEFYSPHKGKHFYEILIEFVTSGPVIGMVWEGKDAIKKIRTVCGVTDPKNSEPGTIRRDFGLSLTCNSIHASVSHDDFERESSIFFSNDEIYEYELLDKEEFKKFIK